LLFYYVDGFLRNVGKYIPDYTVSEAIRQRTYSRYYETIKYR